MFCKVLFLGFWFNIMNISDGLNFSVVHTTDLMKYKSLSIQPLDKISEIACGFQCERNKCCAASYDISLQKCYLHQSCFGNVEIVPGWKILHDNILIKTIYITQKKSWDGGQAHCVSLGGRLAVVNTAEKHNLIMSYNTGKNAAWVGASDRDEEGTWVWHIPTQPVLLDYWATGRPDNSDGIQHCMGYLNHVGFIWDDRDCSELYDFICDIPERYGPS